MLHVNEPHPDRHIELRAARRGLVGAPSAMMLHWDTRRLIRESDKWATSGLKGVGF